MQGGYTRRLQIGIKVRNSIYCSLQEHFVEEKTSWILLQTINTKFRDDGGVLDIKTFGKYIRALFKNVLILKKAGKYLTVYNLKENVIVETSDKSVGLNSIQKWTPSTFYYVKKEMKRFTLQLSANW